MKVPPQDDGVYFLDIVEAGKIGFHGGLEGGDGVVVVGPLGGGGGYFLCGFEFEVLDPEKSDDAGLVVERRILLEEPL